MSLKSHAEAIRKQDPAIKSPLEIILYPSFWAIGFHRLAHKLFKGKLFFLARLISQFARFLTGIEIHPGAKIGGGVFIDHGMGVVIGETCEIGDGTLIYQGATFGGTGKDTGKRHPTIGRNVMVGAGVKVLGPIKVGDNARIGAGSVVLSEVPEGATAVGVPARIVSRRNSTDALDQVHMPDPVSMEFCKLRAKIDELEKKIAALEKKAGKEQRDAH